MQGTLSPGALPGLLRALYVGRRTGQLHLSRGEDRRDVRFRQGHIVAAGSTIPQEHLGEVLVRAGWITPAQLDAAAQAMRAGGKRLGEVLVEQGVMDRDRLDDALALHVREVLQAAFASADGAFEFQDAPEPPPDAEMTLKVSTGELILETVRRLTDPGLVSAALGNTDRVLGLSGDPLLRFQKVALTPTDGYVLSRIDGVMSAREVIEMTALPTEEVERSLYGLLCTGIVEYVPGLVRAARRAAVAAGPKPDAAPAPPANGPMASAATPRPVAPPPPAAPPPAPAPDPAAAKKKMVEERRREIVEMYEGRSRNHFEVLGITRSANEQQVKEAYFSLAKRFHPDAHHDPELDDLRDKLEAVFIRLGEAYEKLRNPKSRGLYESDLAAREPRRFNPPTAQAPSAPSAPGAAPPAAEEPPAEPQMDEVRAAQAVHRAEKLIADSKFFDAIQLLEPALEVLAGKKRAKARLLLATAYSKNPNWTRQAENELKKAVTDDPRSVEAHFRLAEFYRLQGMKTRASSLYRRVLELQPEHAEAGAALADTLPLEEAPKESRGGFLGRLFKKE
jgi:curved DNA-binding protein CbpA